MQLQQNLPDLEARGLGLVAISYDPPATLKSFADQHRITFPLLSDPGSKIITRYNLLNASAAGRMAGIPYPGTFVLDARGIVIARSFEEAYQERASASSLAVRTQPARATASPGIETAHLRLSTSSSDATVAPGTRFSLVIDVTPKARMHVYTPEQKEYIPVSLALGAQEGVKVHPPAFPPSEKLFFKPLNETQLVYSKPFRIVQDVTVGVTPAMVARARTAGASLTLTGTLKYQACDDSICYLPVSVPVKWTVGLKPLER